jgi:hypothetical protein
VDKRKRKTIGQVDERRGLGTHEGNVTAHVKKNVMNSLDLCSRLDGVEPHGKNTGREERASAATQTKKKGRRLTVGKRTDERRPFVKI